MANKMSYFSAMSSRFNNIRRTFSSDESDGDTEDDTHLCRVLRAYYIDKGRAFPPWLPPDPKTPPPVQPQYSSTQSGGRGGMGQQQVGGGRGLRELWDSQPQQQQ